MKDGSTYKEGERLVQKDLAKTLSSIAKNGKDGFYKGRVAQQIVQDFQANDGFLTMEDLANYKAKKSVIVKGNYRGHDLHGLWLPSFGAITIEILHILEQLPMDQYHGADWASAVGQAITLGYRDRQRQKFGLAVTDTILNKSYAKELAAQIDVNSPSISAGSDMLAESWTSSLGHTTHLSATDETGMMVGIIQSLGRPIWGRWLRLIKT